ncbi:MAG: DUF3015 domain-containing protein [Myxococcales bacterium]|nr:DUF3015 domain-containing protein [Myxococcales bacterium]
MKYVLSAVAAIAMMAVFFPTSEAQADGYGPAGCGLGSIVIGNKAGITQLFAGTTNGTSGNQSFGITFGTLNCGLDGPTSGAVANFVEANRSAIAKDMARGSGETISTLATIAGCSNRAAVGSTLQKNFRKVFSSAAMSDKQVGLSLLNLLKQEKALGCNKLS